MPLLLSLGKNTTKGLQGNISLSRTCNDSPGAVHVENCFLDESSLYPGNRDGIISLKKCSFKNSKNQPVAIEGGRSTKSQILVEGCDFYCPQSHALTYKKQFNGEGTIVEMRANRFCCKAILKTTASFVVVAMVDSVVYYVAN
eukprot:TRINITY_DN2398_c0_g1_i1.p1 TRINITY_DN2398_c0_g1~~TRINITY_DN2398_c0_g1_i1.p1  ORF type:complete len:143 (-),score=8.36 TRINITY_DN2398_c0_g1_i1:93-521(-)